MAAAARKPDFIDAAARFGQADADALNARFAGSEISAALATLLEEGALGRVAVVSSFGTESAVLLHLVARVDPTRPGVRVAPRKLF